MLAAFSRHAMGCFNSLWLTWAVRGVLAVRSGIWEIETLWKKMSCQLLGNHWSPGHRIQISQPAVTPMAGHHGWIQGSDVISFGTCTCQVRLMTYKCHKLVAMWPKHMQKLSLMGFDTQSVGLIFNLLKDSCHEKLLSHHFLKSWLMTCAL